MTPDPDGAAVSWDPAALNRLRAQLGDRDGSMMAEIVTLYLAQGPDLLDQLEVAAASSDERYLRSAAHSLKGSTATVGGMQLVVWCEQLEQGQSSRPLESVRAARREFDLLAGHLDQYLSGTAQPQGRRR